MEISVAHGKIYKTLTNVGPTFIRDYGVLICQRFPQKCLICSNLGPVVLFSSRELKHLFQIWREIWQCFFFSLFRYAPSLVEKSNFQALLFIIYIQTLKAKSLNRPFFPLSPEGKCVFLPKDARNEPELRPTSHKECPEIFFSWLIMVLMRPTKVIVCLFFSFHCVIYVWILAAKFGDAFNVLEWSPYMNGPSKLDAPISSKQFFGLKFSLE